jgi:hypothetical protein
LTERKDKESSAHRPLFRARRDIEFLGLALKLFGELHQLSAPDCSTTGPSPAADRFRLYPGNMSRPLCIPVRTRPLVLGHWLASDWAKGTQEHASRRDRDHRLSRSRFHKIGSANAAAIPRLFVGMRRIVSVDERGRQLRRPTSTSIAGRGVRREIASGPAEATRPAEPMQRPVARVGAHGLGCSLGHAQVQIRTKRMGLGHTHYSWCCPETGHYRGLCRISFLLLNTVSSCCGKNPIAGEIEK